MAALIGDVFLVVSAHFCDFLLPEVLINIKELVEDLRCNLVLNTLEVDVTLLGKVTDSSFFSVDSALAALDDPVENSHVIAEAGPHEVTFLVLLEPVNIEDLRSLVAELLAHFEPVCPVVTNIVADEGLHCHRIVTENADSTYSSSCCLGGNSRTDVSSVCPVEGLIYQRSGGSTSAAEDDSGNGNTVRIVELRRYAGAVNSRSCKSGVGVSQLLRLAVSTDNRSVFLAVYLSALPLSCILGRILVETFPPNCVISIVESNVCEDGVLHCGSKCVVVGLSVSTGSNAEEAVLGVDSIKSAVSAGLHPSDIITNGEYFVALILVSLRRNEHCEVGLAASRGECSCNVNNLAVGLLNAEDKHMLSHPAFVLALVGSDTECKALLAEENVSAVCGVDGPDSVVLRELNNVSVFGINISLGVETSYEIVGGIAQVLKSLLAHSCHDVHVKNNVDRVSKLNTDLSERRTDRTHGVRDNIHGSTLHNAVIKRSELSIHFLRIHPVVGRTCFFLGRCADECSVLYTSNVVGKSSVVQAAGKLLLVKSVHLVSVAFGKGANLVSKSIELLLAAVDPYNLVRPCESDHFVNPLEYVRIVCK